MQVCTEELGDEVDVLEGGDEDVGQADDLEARVSSRRGRRA